MDGENPLVRANQSTRNRSALFLQLTAFAVLIGAVTFPPVGARRGSTLTGVSTPG
jgi:hypothetical protein